MGTFEDVFHITLYSNNSDILEISAGTVLTLCFYKYKPILQRQSLKLSIFISIVLPVFFLVFLPIAYNKLHGFYYRLRQLLKQYCCHINVLSKTYEVAELCVTKPTHLHFTSTFRQNRRQRSNNPNKKEVLNVNISYENNKFFLENFQNSKFISFLSPPFSHFLQSTRVIFTL